MWWWDTKKFVEGKNFGSKEQMRRADTEGYLLLAIQKNDLQFFDFKWSVIRRRTPQQTLKVNLRAHNLVVSNLRSETKGSLFESGCYLCVEVSSLR